MTENEKEFVKKLQTLLAELKAENQALRDRISGRLDVGDGYNGFGGLAAPSGEHASTGDGSALTEPPPPASDVNEGHV